jgi:hypothetical protein
MWRAAKKQSAFILGVDLGQSQDYTALCVLEKLTIPTEEWDVATLQQKTATVLHVRYLERPPLGNPYPAIVERVKTLLQQLPSVPTPATLVVDATGVGRPVADLFAAAQLDPVAVTITGGDKESHERGDYRVPKRNLVGILQVALQTGQLKVAKSLPEAAILVEELLNFKVKSQSVLMTPTKCGEKASTMTWCSPPH